MHDDRWERITLTEIREEYEALGAAVWHALSDLEALEDTLDWLTPDDTWHPAVRAQNEAMARLIALETFAYEKFGKFVVHPPGPEWVLAELDRVMRVPAKGT
jgi:hypothetical protein